jgi:3-oxoadipate enol-lactonase
MPFVPVGSYEIHYQDVGDGFPIVFIHGLAGDMSAWEPQVNTLKNRYRCITFDNRGAGRSTQRDEPITTMDMARDTLGIMDALDVTRAHVVGRSMGGAIAQHVALLRSSAVQSLVLCASFARLDPIGERVLTLMRQVLEWRGNWVDHAAHSVPHFISPSFFNEYPDVVAEIEALIASTDRLPECYVRQNHACLQHDVLDRLGSITQPTLIMAGGRDPICSMTATRWMGDRLPAARTVIFEESSHFFLIEESERFMQTLTAWLDENTP